MNHKCPTQGCPESYQQLPDLRDHLTEDHDMTMKQAKRAVFGVIGGE